MFYLNINIYFIFFFFFFYIKYFKIFITIFYSFLNRKKRL